MDYVVIVAGGKGTRMGADLPKQFLPVAGQPVLMHTIRRFREYSQALGIVVVLPREQQNVWKELCQKHQFEVEHTVVDGGQTRYHSSKNGLDAIPSEQGVVAFHDGVRPFVSVEVIGRCYETARQTGAAIPVMPVTDTLRLTDKDGSRNVLRSNYHAVQTPQAFRIALAKEAFSQPWQESFTDDASVVEAAGFSVTMVEGCRENIKLTTPFDLDVAEVIAAK